MQPTFYRYDYKSKGQHRRTTPLSRHNIEQRPVEQLVPGARITQQRRKSSGCPAHESIAQERKHPHSRQVCLERHGSAERLHSSAAIICSSVSRFAPTFHRRGGKKDMNDIFERRDGEILRGTKAEVRESLAPVWERMPGERARAYEAAGEYFKMGPKRSHAAVARALNKEVSQMQRWSKRWLWGSRAKAYDDHLARLEQNAIEKQASEYAAKWQRRTEEHLEKKCLIGEKLETKADQMLAFPLAAITTDGGKTTVQPGRWTVKDVPAIIAVAGMSIGQKGMIVAAKAVAATGADLFSDRQLVLDAKADFRRQMEGKIYQSVIPVGQKPPLNYRNK
jgi:hypothetical protein